MNHNYPWRIHVCCYGVPWIPSTKNPSHVSSHFSQHQPDPSWLSIYTSTIDLVSSYDLQTISRKNQFSSYDLGFTIDLIDSVSMAIFHLFFDETKKNRARWDPGIRCRWRWSWKAVPPAQRWTPRHISWEAKPWRKTPWVECPIKMAWKCHGNAMEMAWEYLVGGFLEPWNEWIMTFQKQLGMEYLSQLTNSIIFRGVAKNHQPEMAWQYDMSIHFHIKTDEPWIFPGNMWRYVEKPTLRDTPRKSPIWVAGSNAASVEGYDEIWGITDSVCFVSRSIGVSVSVHFPLPIGSMYGIYANIKGVYWW